MATGRASVHSFSGCVPETFRTCLTSGAMNSIVEPFKIDARMGEESVAEQVFHDSSKVCSRCLEEQIMFIGPFLNTVQHSHCKSNGLFLMRSNVTCSLDRMCQ